MIRFLVVGFLTQLVTAIAHLAGVWLTSRWLGVPVQRVQIGIGPTPLRGKVGAVTLALGFPLGSYVQFQRDEPEADASTESAPGADPPPDAFEKASRPKRVLIALAGPFAMAAIPLVGLGPIEGARVIGRGVPQLVLGAISPLGTAQELLSAGAALPTLTLALVLAAKLVSYNLLPIPGTSMWTALRSLVGFGWGRGCVGALVPFAAAVSWLVAIVAWALS